MPESPTPATPSGDEATLLLRAKQIFLEARPLGLAERHETIERACGDHAALRQLVWSLLEGDAAPLGIESLADDIRAVSGRDGGDRIGHYRLLERIGEGGFGVVYAAEQERPVRRRVALKIIKLGMDTKQVVARFEAERQALALMDHPSIARVYDGGVTPTGRPYFVMELVKGLPITEYCERGIVSIEERLKLVVRVCAALRHAHQKGVIHRDIKPTNVLIVTEDGKPEPKIIDFGVAKAVSGKLTDRTLYTEVRQIIGTPEYMSPEQADPTVQDVDTRADVYGVGVLLYELLTGTTPFASERLRTAAYGEMQRIIREEDPPAPSTRVKAASGGARSHASGSPRRKADLRTSLRGELDWIVMKAIEKDRSRRYASVAELAADIERFLQDEAIHAAPPSRAYLARKFVRKHRAAVGASAVLLAALVIGLIGTVVGLTRSEAQRRVAEAERVKADTLTLQARAAESLATRRAYSAGMMSASTALGNLQIATATEFLRAIPEADRTWEWRVLEARLDSSIRALLTPLEYSQDKENFRLGLTLHPDGKSFFTTDEFADVCLRQFDLATGHLLRELRAPRGGSGQWLTRVRLTPDGTSVVAFSFSTSGTVASGPAIFRRWQLESGAEQTHEMHFPVHHAAIAPDGGQIVCFDGQELFVVDAKGRRLLDRPAGLAMPVAFDDRLGLIVTGETSGGWVSIRDARTLERVVLAEGHGSLIDATVSPDERSIATAADDDTARIWEVHKPESLDPSKTHAAEGPGAPFAFKVLPHPNRVGGVVFSHDSTMLATVGNDSTVRIWDRESGNLRLTIPSGDLVPRPLMFTKDDRMIAGMHKDGTVRFWSLDAENTRVLRGHSNIVSCVKFVPERSMIVSGGWDQGFGTPGIVRVWDGSSGDAVGAWEGRPDDICRAVSVSRDGCFAAVAIAEVHAARVPTGRMVLLDLRTGRVLWQRAREESVTNCFFTSDASKVVFLAEKSLDQRAGELILCDAATGDTIRTLPMAGYFGITVAMSPDGRVIAVTERQASAGQIRLLAAETLEEIGSIPFDGASAMGFSPEGKRLAAAHDSGVIDVFDVGTRDRIGRMTGHSMVVMAIAFSPDGTRIASSGVDRVIRLWDATTFDPVGVLAGHTGHIGNLDWERYTGRDGKKLLRLVSCSGDSTVRVWEEVPLRERVEARELRRGAMQAARTLLEQWNVKSGTEAVLERLKGIEDAATRSAAEGIILAEGLRAAAQPLDRSPARPD